MSIIKYINGLLFRSARRERDLHGERQIRKREANRVLLGRGRLVPRQRLLVGPRLRQTAARLKHQLDARQFGSEDVPAGQV